MRTTELPPSTLVGMAYEESQISVLLQKVVGTECPIFCSTEPIKGIGCSGRVLYTTPDHGVSLPKLMNTQEMAREIEKLTKEARYSYNFPPRPGLFVKGWELRASCRDNYPVVIVWAVWVPKNLEFFFPSS